MQLVVALGCLCLLMLVGYNLCWLVHDLLFLFAFGILFGFTGVFGCWVGVV